MREAALILQIEVRPFPEFADRMAREEFRGRPFGRRFPGDSLGAVLAELERGGMLRIGSGAARAIKPVRLVHGEETASLLDDRLLATNGICYRLQSTPPSRSSLVFADANDIVVAHCALHNLGDVRPKGNFGVGTTFPSEIMDVGTERDMLN